MTFFTGKTAIITGAGSGIGRALALALGAAGARVVITDIDQERIDDTLAELKRRGITAGGYRVDHANEADTRRFAAEFLAEWKQVDVLCLNAGIGHGARIEDTAVEDWRRVMGVNLWGVVYLLHEMLPGMIRQGRGSVLITASQAGLSPLPAMTVYNASKAAAVAIAETLHTELRPHNIGVTALCPGIISTNIVRDGDIRFGAENSEQVKARIVEFYAQKGTQPSVVAHAALRALEKNKVIAPTPLHAWPLYILHRLSPGLYASLMAALWRRGWVGPLSVR